jgi:hypothetical protein
MKMSKLICVGFFLGFASPTLAGNLRFEQVNPAFGGNPNLNGYIVGTAQIQNQFLESGGSGGNAAPDISFPPIVIDLGGLSDEGDVVDPAEPTTPASQLSQPLVTLP